MRLSLSLTRDGDPGKSIRLNNLGVTLQRLFQRHGSLADLEDAISSLRLAVPLVPDGHPEKQVYLSNLGTALNMRFERYGSLADLEDAISSLRLAVSLVPDGHPKKQVCFVNLGNAQNARFDRHGSIADLEDAISNLRLALSLTPDGHPLKPDILNNLGSSLLRRFQRHDSSTDLEDAISSMRLAVSLTPDGHPAERDRLNNLGGALQKRFRRYGSPADLEDAISSLRLAVSLTPDGHPGKPICLGNLGPALEKRFERHGSLTDLEDAISSMRLAVSLTPDGHSDKSLFGFNLANGLYTLFQRSGDRNHLQSALSAAKDSALLLAAPSTLRLKSAFIWATCCLSGSTNSLPAFDYTINLLPRVAWLGLPPDDQYTLLTEVGRVSRHAVAAAIFEGELPKALEWAEQGRSIVWQNLLSLRTPLDELQHHHPELSQRITRLQEISQQLESPGEARRSLNESQLVHSADHQMKLANERDKLIDEVRSTPGHESFMKPKSLHNLAPAARDGPIVSLNLGILCDALILTMDDSGSAHVLSIRLEGVTLEKAEELSERFVRLLRSVGRSVSDDARDLRKARRDGGKTNDEESFKEILHILWTDYVQPIIDGLGYSVADGKPPRLWWCTTGPLAFLPLHAAGYYDTTEIGHKLSDYVVSSYTPSIEALLDQSPPTPSENPKILTVAISNTPGMPIPSTETEVENLHHLTVDLPTVSLKNNEATKERVLEELAQCNWAHLACHGVQVGGEPMSSGLILGDGKLELSEIIKTRLPNAEFAFLSACETAVGDRGVPEESAHLAAGMLFAGFRGVIATMWAINDDVAPQVAEDVYRAMLGKGKPDYEEAVYGLHKATRNLRERGEPFQNWVPFIHVGR